MQTPVLELSGVTKTFATERRARRKTQQSAHAVDNVSLSVSRGQTHAVVGESGAGKSTLARLAMRLIHPDAGRVRLGGVDITDLGGRRLRQHRSRMQMVFQDPYGSFDPSKSIGWSISQPLKIHSDLDKQERLERTVEVADQVGLAEQLLLRRPKTLSGGQLQRAAIARALITSPELLVCDEPVAALDVSIGAQVLNLIADLQAKYEFAIVFISHDLSLVQSIADTVSVMRSGRIVEVGPPSSVFVNPQNGYTAQLVESVPSITAGLRRVRGGVDLP